MTKANSINAGQTGVQYFDGTSAFSGVTGTTGQVLQANTSAAPTYSTATYPSTATGTGTLLRADGTNWVATTSTYPNTNPANTLLYASSANTMAALATGNSLLAATNSSGTLAMRAFSINVQTFTSTGTYTPTAGMLYCIVQCVGGGGGGGGCQTNAAGSYSAGGGGGSGELAYGIFSASTIGASKAVTIGAAGTAGSAGSNAGGTGGTSSFGSTLLSAIGGTGGAGGPSSTTATSAAGGAGGTGGTVATYNLPGIQGGFSLYSQPTNLVQGGGGAPSPLGGGGAVVNISGNSAGTSPVATSYGAGGSGGIAVSGGGQQAGGAGIKGVVIVTEYIIA